MAVYSLQIATPDGLVFSGDAVSLSVRGEMGDLAVLSGHAPFMTTVKGNKLKLLLPDGSVKQADILGGLLSVGKTETVLLCASLRWEDEE